MGATYRAREQRHPRPARDIVNRDAIERAVIEPRIGGNAERPAEAAAVGEDHHELSAHHGGVGGLVGVEAAIAEQRAERRAHVGGGAAQ